MNLSGCYILEFSSPLGTERQSARYYKGKTENLTGRLWHHRHGRGAAITRAAVQQGIQLNVVAWFPSAWIERYWYPALDGASPLSSFELWMRQRKNTPRIVRWFQILDGFCYLASRILRLSPRFIRIMNARFALFISSLVVKGMVS